MQTLRRQLLPSATVRTLAAVLAVLGTMLFGPGVLASASAADFNPSAGTYTVNTTPNPPTLTGPGTNITGTDQNGVAVFSFDNVTIPSGVTINVSGSLPFELQATGDLSLAGEINGSGASATAFNAASNAGGPGGGAGGSSSTQAGSGPGGGGAGGSSSGEQTGGSGGGGFGGAGAPGGTTGGATAGAGGVAYGNLNTTLEGGSGGAAGSDTTGGGGGGGAVELSADVLTISSTGEVLANGGNGNGGDFGASGGGSGGGILIQGNTVNITGTLSADGGQGGSGGVAGDGGGGGGGRIDYQYATLQAAGTANVSGGTSGTAGSFGHGGESADATGFEGVVTYTQGALVTTEPASGVTETGAVLNADVTPNGTATTYHFEYGTTTAYGSQIPATDEAVGSDNTSHAVSQSITGLSPGTTYHFRIVATDAYGIVSRGADETFTTAPGPSATTGPASGVSDTGATLNGQVNPNGITTTYHFDYGTTTAYGTQVPLADAAVGSDSTSHAVSQSITGLSPGTTYHFEIVATDANGIVSTGADQTFTTGPGPSATTEPASGLSDTGATLNGEVNPNGTATTYHFEYGTTTAYGTQVPEADQPVGSDNDGHAVSQSITGLSPGTTYHFEIVATDANGIVSTGADQTFTTAPVPSVTTEPASGVTETAATLNGQVNPNGTSTIYHFEYGTTTGYGSQVPAADQPAGADGTSHTVSQTIAGLSPGTTYHFRIVATDANGIVSSGADQTFTTAPAPSQPATSPPPTTPAPISTTKPPSTSTVASVKVSGTKVLVSLSCTTGSGPCVDQLELTVLEALVRSKVTAVAARKHTKTRHLTVVVGKTTVTLSPGQTETVAVALNAKGRALLSKFGKLGVRLLTSQGTTKIKSATVTFKASRKAHKKHK